MITVAVHSPDLARRLRAAGDLVEIIDTRDLPEALQRDGRGRLAICGVRYPAALAAEVAAAVADPPPAGAPSPLGQRPMTEDDLAAITAALEAAWNDPEAHGYFASDFAFGHLDRLARYGTNTRFTVRQWAVIDEILARHAEITAREAGEADHE